MAAFGKVNWGALAPVGDKISLHELGGEPDQFLQLEGFEHHLVNSGTAALALAMLVVKSRRTDLAEPEVILPGYACPDLVAAAVYAGLTPVLVDIGVDDPAYDLSALANAISVNTALIVAVNFLGIRENVSAIRSLVADKEISILEDCAQSYPLCLPDTKSRPDFIITSFGRGKPISLLGGGVLWVSKRIEYDSTKIQTLISESKRDRSFKIKTILYNILIHPSFYRFLLLNPLMTLGATVFKSLDEISTLDVDRIRLIESNLLAYRGVDSRWRCDYLTPELSKVAPNWVLPSHFGNREGRLLRYPVLCGDHAQRDRIVDALSKNGLGSSVLYGSELSCIDNVSTEVKISGDLNNARSFSQRLFTLPIHGLVDHCSLQRMIRVINESM